MPGHVFISYRWGTASSDAAGRLYSELQRQLPQDRINLDVQNRPTGEGLRKRIQDDVKAADVMLLAIHPEWLAAIPRLNDQDDLVRLEIEAALEFGITIIPVLLNGSVMPTGGLLPASIQPIANLPAVTIGEHAAYAAGIDRLCRDIRGTLPGTFLRLLNWVANNSPANVVLGLMILGALMIFLSRMLEIHTFSILVRVMALFGQGQETELEVKREVGLMMAWNWTAVVLLITPAMYVIFANTLRHAKELLDILQFRKMVYYIGEPGVTEPIGARRLWESVARPTSSWCKVFAAIAVVLGTVQWWQYSGQWFFKGYSGQRFMLISTGPDWNIGWAIVDALAPSGLAITAFVLLMYIVYGVGSFLTYSYYAFLFNFFAELSQLATSAGSRSSEALRLDMSDRDAGGLASFRTIQRDHAAFCLWSLFAMYLMALRNAYLPLVCRLPAGVASSLVDDDSRLGQCSNMVSFSSNIYRSTAHFVGSVLGGAPDFGVLFFAYSEQNLFVLGSLLHVCLITSFFYLISSRMTAIVETARHGADSEVADVLLRKIRFENGRVIAIMSIGALATIFLNLGPLVLFVAMATYSLERWMSVRGR